MTTNNAETIRAGAEVLDTLTSNLPDTHPLRIEAAGRAKELVASLYALADAMDQPAMAVDAEDARRYRALRQAAMDDDRAFIDAAEAYALANTKGMRYPIAAEFDAAVDAARRRIEGE